MSNLTIDEKLEIARNKLTGDPDADMGLIEDEEVQRAIVDISGGAVTSFDLVMRSIDSGWNSEDKDTPLKAMFASVRSALTTLVLASMWKLPDIDRDYMFDFLRRQWSDKNPSPASVDYYQRREGGKEFLELTAQLTIQTIASALIGGVGEVEYEETTLSRTEVPSLLGKVERGEVDPESVNITMSFGDIHAIMGSTLTLFHGMQIQKVKDLYE